MNGVKLNNGYVKYNNFNISNKNEKIHFGINVRYIFIPKNIQTKEAVIALYAYGLDLDIHDFNWDAFADGLGNVHIKYRQIIIEHEDFPNLDPDDLTEYLGILDDNS
jgi:hypothetical protein